MLVGCWVKTFVARIHRPLPSLWLSSTRATDPSQVSPRWLPQRTPDSSDDGCSFSTLRLSEATSTQCKTFTGEESMSLVVLPFEYLNARGGFDDLNWWRSQTAEKQKKGRGDGGRQRE